MCPHGMAHWRHLANTTELVFPSAHPSQQPKWQIDWFYLFCTAHSRKSLCSTMSNPFPQNCPFSWGDLDPHLAYDSLGPSEPTNQTASLLVRLFLHRWPQSVPILYNRTPLSLSKLPLPMGRSGPHLIHGSLGPPESSTQMACRSVQLF